MPKICSVEGCKRESEKKGLCFAHYSRLQRYGDVMADKPIRKIRKPVNRKKRGRTVIFRTKEHPLYETWRAMVKRCNYKKHPHYDNYGGRGIKVCDRWLGPDGFDNFLEDMGPRPEGKHPSGRPIYTLDRINVDGDYCKENCRWANPHEQRNNTRDAVFITYRGVTHNMPDWIEILRIKPSTFYARRNKHPNEPELWFKELN